MYLPEFVPGDFAASVLVKDLEGFSEDGLLVEIASTFDSLLH